MIKQFPIDPLLGYSCQNCQKKEIYRKDTLRNICARCLLKFHREKLEDRVRRQSKLKFK